MINIEIKYPILLIKSKEQKFYAFGKDLGLISKGGDDFYKKPIKIIDRDGFEFELKEATNIGKASLLNSMRYFQPMQQMKLDFEELGRLNLDELKSLIKSYIKKKPKLWLAIGTVDMICKNIDETKTMTALIKMFR